ncbi:c-type cytochrome [Oryzomicrobium sp.]|uniref:c-type cytochrome n=1 Tax=Oryzomicrobium sp. TaxID=1911578 RepID=UPI002FE10571
MTAPLISPVRNAALGRALRPLLLAAGLALGSAPAQAYEVVRPDVDLSALPPLGDAWRDDNPYRGNPVAVAAGRQVFNQACAQCHGSDADPRQGMPAPDLRPLHRFCQRIPSPELKGACMRDNDAFFATSVRFGKVRVGVVHMPPWQGILPQEAVWAVQAFIESVAR